MTKNKELNELLEKDNSKMSICDIQNLKSMAYALQLQLDSELNDKSKLCISFLSEYKEIMIRINGSMFLVPIEKGE